MSFPNAFQKARDPGSNTFAPQISAFQPSQPFGQPNQPFGQPNQPFGQPSQFGQPNQPFGQPNQFGQPSFGQPSFGQPSFGQPSFGQPSFGQPPQFGQPQQFGQPTFGQPAQPFTPATSTAFGAQSAFGAQTKLSSQSTFGSQPSFAQSSTNTFGTSQNTSTMNTSNPFGPTPSSMQAGLDPFAAAAPQGFPSGSPAGQASGQTPPPTYNEMLSDLPKAKAGPGAAKSKARPKAPPAKQTENHPRKASKPLTLPQFAPTRFVSKHHRPSNDFAILKQLPKPVTSAQFRPDAWDVENQARMHDIEMSYVQNAISLQDAYERLDAMRKTERTEMEKRGLVDSSTQRKALSDATQFVGSCEDMCPVFERIRRAHENMVLPLERNRDGIADRSLAMKAFSRPAAGREQPLPSDVRPPPVLVASLQYLVTELVPKLPQSHSLIWDRTRSIRQDFTFQDYQGPEAVYCHEVIARVHCYCLHFMSQAQVEFSLQQEIEQFNNCLKSIAQFYEVTPSANAGEMFSYMLLSHFDDKELVDTVERGPESRHPLVMLALELRSLAQVSVPQFFARLRQPDVPLTLRAVAEIHFNDIRCNAMRNLAAAVHTQINMYSLPRFAKLLGFETVEEATGFCDYFDVNIVEGEVDLRTWSELNIRDKRKPGIMTDSFDIAGVDLLVGANGNEGQTKSADLESRKKRLSEMVSQRRPEDEAAHKAEAARKESQKAAREEAQKAAREEAQKAAREEAQKAEAARKAEAKREAEMKAAQEAAVKAQELQKQEVLRRQAELREAKRQRDEQVAMLEREHLAQRAAQRAQFVADVGDQIFNRLFAEIPVSDVQNTIRGVEIGCRFLLRRVVHQIRDTARRCLARVEESRSRAEELVLFRQKRPRTVSRREHNNSLDSVSMTTVNGNAASHSCFSMEMLKQVLAPAVVAGLHRLTVLCPENEQGEWLRGALRVGSSIEVFPDEFCVIAGKPEPGEEAVVLKTSSDSLNTVYSELEALMNEFVSRQQTEFGSLRSLGFKRRRLSTAPKTPSPVSFEQPEHAAAPQRQPSLLDGVKDRLNRALARTKRTLTDEL